MSKSVNLRRFQKASNGFDVRGVTAIREGELLDGPFLSEHDAFWFGFGFSKWLLSRSKNPNLLSVGIGCDCRSSGPVLSSWFAGGVEAGGLIAYEVGLCTTPSMFLSCCDQSRELSSKIKDYNVNYLPFTGAVCLTASHLPSQWNGIKFFDAHSPSNIGEEGIDKVIALASDPQYSHVEPCPASVKRDVKPFLPVYSEFLKHTVRTLLPYSDLPLSGLKICVNAGNGAGGFLADTLSDLGADTSPSLHLSPDGTFPHHIANPEDRVAITTTAKAVLESQSDVGICLDTDADRTGLVDASGRLLNRNALIALVSKIALNGLTDGVIVTDSATSNGLTAYIQEGLGGRYRHIRYKKGYRHVIELGRGTEGCVAAVECSGHGAWRDNGWVDDGCYTAVRLVVELAAMKRRAEGSVVGSERDEKTTDAERAPVTLSGLLKGFHEPEESVELRFRAYPTPLETDAASHSDRGVELEEGVDMTALTEKAVSVLHMISSHANGWQVEPDNHEGIRLKFHMVSKDATETEEVWDGWCMIRASLHEPILSMQIESEQSGGTIRAAQLLLHGPNESVPGLEMLSDVLDLKPLKAFIENS